MYGKNWKTLRNVVLKRDGFKCRSCGKKEVRLNVHHLCYFSNMKPDDIPVKYLVTLCKGCHSRQHYFHKKSHFRLISEKYVTKRHLKIIDKKPNNKYRMSLRDKKLQARYDLLKA